MTVESHHFSDYGFDPQIDYFQVLEEARRKYRRSADNYNNNNNIASSTRSNIDSLNFKLQKPISKDDSKKQNKVKWWRNAILFLRRRLVEGSRRPYDDRIEQNRYRGGSYLGSKSGPIYLTESRSGSNSPYRRSSGPIYLTESRSGSNSPYRSRSGPASGRLTPARIEIPYISLRDHNHDEEVYEGTNSAMPIYLVT